MTNFPLLASLKKVVWMFHTYRSYRPCSGVPEMYHPYCVKSVRIWSHSGPHFPAFGAIEWLSLATRYIAILFLWKKIWLQALVDVNVHRKMSFLRNVLTVKLFLLSIHFQDIILLFFRDISRKSLKRHLFNMAMA